MGYDFNLADWWKPGHDGGNNWRYRRAETPTPSGEDLTVNQSNMLGRYSLQERLGRTARASRIGRRLERRFGIDAAGTLEGLSEEERNRLAPDALARMASKGAIKGKAAKRLNAELVKEENLASLDKEMEAANVFGTDELASQYGMAAHNIRALLGPDVDMSSPAVASILAGMAEGRSTGLADFKNRLQTNLLQRQTDVRNNIDLNVIGENLDQTGALAEALAQLRKEEQRLAEANRGAIRGSPTASLYTGFGGSNEGAIPFSNSLWTSIQRFMSMYSAASSMGGGASSLQHENPNASGGPVFAPNG